MLDGKIGRLRTLQNLVDVACGTMILIRDSNPIGNEHPALGVVPETPVTLLPGRARLVMSPLLTGSAITHITIGMVDVARLAARVA